MEELLKIYWLRPETVLWRYLDNKAMNNFKFNSPSLDIGGGDGLLSFVRAGGEFDDLFDAFQSMKDMTNYFDGEDVWNHYDDSLKPIITKEPDYKIDYILDHKQALLDKAKTLNLYNNFVQHDANEKLPFKDNEFNTIYSNIVYWLDKPEETFKEIFRILNKDGECCLFLPNSTYPDFSFYNELYLKTGDEDFEFLKFLDRGNLSEIKSAKSYDEWKVLIENSGLSIKEHKMHLSKTVMQIWHIGLRPIFPLLLEMVNSIDNKDKLKSIKRKWIETFNMMLKPIADMDEKLNQNKEHAFHMFILKK
jgi:ubiquinone/menaquinone biosynthesis C-methylase UbiE